MVSVLCRVFTEVRPRQFSAAAKSAATKRTQQQQQVIQSRLNWLAVHNTMELQTEVGSNTTTEYFATVLWQIFQVFVR